MNITKSYLRQLIKEELNKLEEESELEKAQSSQAIQQTNIKDPARAKAAWGLITKINTNNKLKEEDVVKLIGTVDPSTAVDAANSLNSVSDLSINKGRVGKIISMMKGIKV